MTPTNKLADALRSTCATLAKIKSCTPLSPRLMELVGNGISDASEALAAHAASLAAPPAQREFLPADEQPPFAGIAGCRPLERAPQPAPAPVQPARKTAVEVLGDPRDSVQMHDGLAQLVKGAQPPAPGEAVLPELPEHWNNGHTEWSDENRRTYAEDYASAAIAALQQAQQDKHECERCGGFGWIKERPGSDSFDYPNPKAPCPNCDETGYTISDQPSAPVQPDDVSVICPGCAHQFRAFPAQSRRTVREAVLADAAAIERALAYLAFQEDGAQWPDAYSEEEQQAERENMRGAFAAANCTSGPRAYCRACQAVGMSNCQHFDECEGATCITCHRPLNVALAQQRVPDADTIDQQQEARGNGE